MRVVFLGCCVSVAVAVTMARHVDQHVEESCAAERVDWDTFWISWAVDLHHKDDLGEHAGHTPSPCPGVSRECTANEAQYAAKAEDIREHEHG